MGRSTEVMHGHLDKQAALELYRRGLTDQEIANQLGVSRRTVSDWRDGRGLNSNVHIAANRRTPLQQDAYDAFRLGLTYGQFKSRYPAGLPDRLKEKPKKRSRKKEE